MIRQKRGVAIAGILIAAWLSKAQEAPQVSVATILETMTARDTSLPSVWYAKFEVQHEGPAELFEVPDAEYGQQCRYRSVEEWWTDGTRCAVALSRESERYLDEELLESNPAGPDPLFVYVHDGKSVTYLDFQHPGRKLVLNTSWPYENAAIPILFGRGFGTRHYNDELAGAGEIVASQPYLGRNCQVMSWAKNRTRVESWLAEELGYLCIRDLAFVNDIQVLDRVYNFATSATGLRYPSDAVERFTTTGGSETIKSWRLMEFDESPTLPFFVFAPSANDVALVIDEALATTPAAVPAETGSP